MKVCSGVPLKTVKQTTHVSAHSWGDILMNNQSGQTCLLGFSASDEKISHYRSGYICSTLNSKQGAFSDYMPHIGCQLLQVNNSANYLTLTCSKAHKGYFCGGINSRRHAEITVETQVVIISYNKKNVQFSILL